jgi:hypothetical protein
MMVVMMMMMIIIIAVIINTYFNIDIENILQYKY